MLDAVRAEALKLRRHRATWLMVWIFPIVFAAISIFQIGRDLWGFAADPPVPAAAWIDQSTAIWRLPLDGGGRFILAGFTALVFAGEYGWNTWKLIIPARRRWQLIGAKWLVSALFVLLALAGADLIGLIGSWLRAGLGGPAIPADVTMASLAQAHATAAGNALLPIIYTIAWAGLFAVLTTSVLATLILSFALVLLEQLLLPLGMVAYGYAPSLTTMTLKALPLYYMSNFVALAKGSALSIPLGTDATLTASWLTSLIIVLSWVALIGATTVVRFNRQDLN